MYTMYYNSNRITNRAAQHLRRPWYPLDMMFQEQAHARPEAFHFQLGYKLDYLVGRRRASYRSAVRPAVSFCSTTRSLHANLCLLRRSKQLEKSQSECSSNP